MRIGLGFDAHELVDRRPLKLGGATIEFQKGLIGHSDGDVILHALSDAILGASAAGDIGMHFRDDDKETEGIDSMRILEFALEQASKAKLALHNIDLVLIADQPKLSKSYEIIRASVAAGCGIQTDRVSVKAKTTEGTSFSKNAIACYAVVLMEEL